VRDASRFIEQVHLTGGPPDEVFVTYITNQSWSSTVTLSSSGLDDAVFHGSSSVYSFLMDSHKEVGTHKEIPLCIDGMNETSAPCYYTSGFVHTVHITGLKPSTPYQYKVEGDSKAFEFTTTPAVGTEAISFGVVADLGQTANSTETVDSLSEHVADKDIDMILFAGDLSYADGYGPRWDSFARLGEKLWARVPTAYVGGNHEVGSGMENWQSFEARYPNNHDRSGSASMLWSSFEAGPAHVLQLCSYCSFDSASLQFKWLQKDLASVDRTRTPWLVAMWHTPWYTSNGHHKMSEGAPMREALEDLLSAHKVDIVFNGHVHAYERTSPIYRNKTDCSNGIPYITVGDGGNREMFATPWLDPQPEWSVLREYAYGHGRFSIHNASHAQWQWLRNPDAWNPSPGQVVGDEVWLRRGAARVC